MRTKGAQGLLVSMLNRTVTSSLLLRQMKSVLDPINHSLRGLNLRNVFFKPRKPRVDKLVAEQLIEGER